MSGIQDFIYSISGSKALKQLRARKSPYLELMMEHIVDELLERLSLNRVNVMYTGGGHAYVLLPNTQQAKAVLQTFENELKDWFIREHGVNLYMAFATVECSADDLSNAGDDKKRFGNLVRELSAKLSDAKAARYSAADIKTLNCGGEGLVDDGRECRECHRSTALASHDDICETCGIIARYLSGPCQEKRVCDYRRLLCIDGKPSVFRSRFAAALCCTSTTAISPRSL